MKPESRCGWCDTGSALSIDYHDSEWGVPLADDRALFQMLVLEGMQAGLSWLTVLKKRRSFVKAFDGFDPAVVAGYPKSKREALQGDRAIIRNRLKINSAVNNAAVVLELQRQYGSFARYLWGWVNYRPIDNRNLRLEEVPAETELSRRIAKDLKKRGMNFVGPTIIYALMQSIGMVNDHLLCCFRHEQCRRLGEKFARGWEENPDLGG